MVEVLISVVILSFGVLGMVGLQAAALQGNRDARLQSIAIGMARELAELMRGNKDVAQDVSSANNPFLGDFSGSPLQPARTSTCLAPGNACPFDIAMPLVGEQNVAAAEMTEWLARIDAALPGARVTVCFDAAPFDADGLPQWACTPASNQTLMVKIGWSRLSTDRSKANTSPVDNASRPSIVLPVTPGNAA